MAISEERLQVLLPRRLKSELKEAARRKGLSIGEYVRQVIDAELAQAKKEPRVPFPFGQNPIRTGRRRGSVDHDRIS